MWVGPTFGNVLWNRFVQDRNETSSFFTPSYKDDSLVRFYTQHGTSADTSQPWGNFRIVYLQYPSDAVTFFSPQSFWKKPEWMDGELPPDISSKLRYIPVVTFLQLLTDNFTATST